MPIPRVHGQAEAGPVSPMAGGMTLVVRLEPALALSDAQCPAAAEKDTVTGYVATPEVAVAILPTFVTVPEAVAPVEAAALWVFAP